MSFEKIIMMDFKNVMKVKDQVVLCGIWAIKFVILLEKISGFGKDIIEVDEIKML